MIYFARIGDDGPIKIGSTTRMSNRLSALRRDHGENMQIIGVLPGRYRADINVHIRFAHLAIRNETLKGKRCREWFSAGPDLLDFIATEAHRWDGREDWPSEWGEATNKWIPDGVNRYAAEKHLNELWTPNVRRGMRFPGRCSMDGAIDAETAERNRAIAEADPERRKLVWLKGWKFGAYGSAISDRNLADRDFMLGYKVGLAAAKHADQVASEHYGVALVRSRECAKPDA